MLVSNFCCTLFYAMSYPYIYAETVKAVSKSYITFEQVISCLGIILFSLIWNKYGNKLFNHYRKFIILEVVADTFLFAHVIVTGNLKFYFLFNVIIYALITKNLSCGGIKMRALVHPNDTEREQYDNNANTVNSIATLLGSVVALLIPFNLRTLFILALLGGVVDNFFYLYIFNCIGKMPKE